MNLTAQEYSIPINEYLEGEQKSEIRHEYLAGRVYAMAGAGEKHNRISLNIAFHLRTAARGKECGVFISDMKVRVEQSDAFYYPDVIVTCDAEDTESLYKHLPCLIVEVLSPATEAIDRREKLFAYRSLPSLRYYLLVSQNKRQVEFFTRASDNRWHTAIIENTGTLEILCEGFEAVFSLDDIYEDVKV